MIGLVLLAEILVIVGGWIMAPEAAKTAMAPAPDALTNTRALGELIYTHYIFLFQAAGVVLLIAMIGAIVLTHRRRKGLRKQKIADQVRRRPEDTVEVRNVETGKGI